LNGTQQLLVHADDVNVFGANINVKETNATLLEVSKEVGLEINVEKTKYMVVSRRQNAGHNHNLTISNKSSENVAKFKYFRMTVT
jgi:hypothetical protein